MKKNILFLTILLISVFSFAQENHLNKADTGILISTLNEFIPIEKIEIIDSNFAVGLDLLEDAGNRPFLGYAFYTGDYGLFENSLGLHLTDTKLVTIILAADKEFYTTFQQLETWLLNNKPKNIEEISNKFKEVLNKNNKNPNNYILLKNQEINNQEYYIISYIYCTKELAKQNGYSVE